MQRLIALAIVITSGSLLSTAYAQNYDAVSTTPAAPSPVMTTDQFKSAVDNYSKQTKSNIATQVEQQTAYRPNKPASSSQSSSSPSSTGTSTQSSGSTPQSNQTSTQGASPQQAPISSLRPSGNTPNAPANNQGDAPPSSQYYTGFGSGQPAEKSNSSSGSQDKSNGSWNVGY